MYQGRRPRLLRGVRRIGGAAQLGADTLSGEVSVRVRCRGSGTGSRGHTDGTPHPWGTSFGGRTARQRGRGRWSRGGDSTGLTASSGVGCARPVWDTGGSPGWVRIVAECSRLESDQRATSRGFKSHTHRVVVVASTATPAARCGRSRSARALAAGVRARCSRGQAGVGDRRERSGRERSRGSRSTATTGGERRTMSTSRARLIAFRARVGGGRSGGSVGWRRQPSRRCRHRGGSRDFDVSTCALRLRQSHWA